VKNISSQLFKRDVKDTFYTQSNRFACDTLFRLTSLLVLVSLAFRHDDWQALWRRYGHA